MEALDILIIVVAVAGAVMGFSRGLLAQVGQIAGVIAAIILSRVFGPAVAQWFDDPESAKTVIISYVLVFIVAYLGVWLVVRAVRGVVRAVHLGFVDRLGGAAFKMAEWLLMVSVALNLYIAVTGEEDGHRDTCRSKPWREAVVDFAPALLGYLSQLDADRNNHPHDGVSTRNEQKTNSDAGVSR